MTSEQWTNWAETEIRELRTLLVQMHGEVIALRSAVQFARWAIATGVAVAGIVVAKWL